MDSGKKQGKQQKKQTKSLKANLVMPVGRIQRKLKEGQYAKRISTSGAVFMAAVLEYLTAEVMELSGNAARDNKKQRINPRHVLLAVRNDDELNTLLKDVDIPEAGVMPFIHPQLLPATSKKGNTAATADPADSDADETDILSQEH